MSHGFAKNQLSTQLADGDYGDVTVSGSGATITVDNDAITFAKIQNITDARLLGRSVGSDGDMMHITVGTGLSLSAGALTATGSSFTAATQAEQEAGSSVAVGVTPGRQQYHPSAAKAWVKFNGTGTVAIDSDYNVDTITDHATGDYSINWDVDFADAKYCAVGTCRQSAAAASATATCENADNVVHSVSALRLYTFTTTTSAPVDTPVICWAAFGDQ